jgi:hypothetical protein
LRRAPVQASSLKGVVHDGDRLIVEQLAGLRVQSLANEIAESYARIQGRDQPPPDAASWA